MLAALYRAWDPQQQVHVDGDKTREKLYFFTKHGVTDGTTLNNLLVRAKDKNESLPNSGEKQLCLSRFPTARTHGGKKSGLGLTYPNFDFLVNCELFFSLEQTTRRIHTRDITGAGLEAVMEKSKPSNGSRSPADRGAKDRVDR